MARWPSDRQKKVTFARIGYEPNPDQVRIHRSRADLIQIVGAEGAGKSFVTASEVVARLPWCNLIYLVGEGYNNTRAEFDYIVSHLLRLGVLDQAMVSRPKQGAWQLRAITGCQVVTLSAKKGASAVIAMGQQPDVIVLCEAGILGSYSVFTASVRRVTRSGGLVIAVGTMKDSYGWYASLIGELSSPDNLWRGETFSLPAWSNRLLYPGGRDDPEIKRLEKLLTEDEFARTIAARRLPSQALVFPEFSYGCHVRECPYDSDLPVTLWIDPGYFPSAYVVLPVQFHGDEVWVIDEIYEHLMTHEEIIQIANRRPWWGNVGYVVMDIASKQHHASRSGQEIWEAAGFYVQSQPVPIMDGILRHHTFLKNPVGGEARLFHDPCCRGTLEEYEKYRRKTDQDGNVISELPIDKDNHSMKAIAYGLVDHFGFVESAEVTPSAIILPVERDRGRW